MTARIGAACWAATLALVLGACTSSGTVNRGSSAAEPPAASAPAAKPAPAKPAGQGGTASTEDFFRGKTIRIIVGFAAGGGYDAYARMIARHIGRHIPGN